MTVVIEESILLFFLGAVFIPIILFFIKLITEIGVIKQKLDSQINQNVRLVEKLEILDSIREKSNIQDLRLANIENNLKRSPN